MKWKYPALLLAGIGVSNVGAWIYLIALNLIVLSRTGSPLAVSILYILLPIAALCTNVWAGSLVDRLDKRSLMIRLDLIRAVLVFLLPFMDSLVLIYLGVFVIHMASSIFAPASLIYMTELIPEADRQRFNALRNFINSSGFILGPSIAGMLFAVGTPMLAIQLNALALCFSAAVIAFLPRLISEDTELPGGKIRMIRNDWNEVFQFSRKHRHVAAVYILFSGLTVFMTALDSLEAAFATRVLLLSESAYGFLISIAGAGIITGSLINAVGANKFRTNWMIAFGAVLTPAGYLIFAYANDFLMASVGFFLLTFALSFANTGFLTFYQRHVPVKLMGRFSSIFGILEAWLIILFTVGIGVSADLYEIRSVYLIGSFAFLGLGVLLAVVSLKDGTIGR